MVQRANGTITLNIVAATRAMPVLSMRKMTAMNNGAVLVKTAITAVMNSPSNSRFKTQNPWCVM